MVLASDISAANRQNVFHPRNREGRTGDVLETVKKKVLHLGGDVKNIAHPSFHDLLRRWLPIALRGDKLNLDALIPWKSIGVELGKWALCTFQIETWSPINPKYPSTKIDHNSYFIRKSDASKTLLNTRKYWKEGMESQDCIFLSLNAIVDPAKDGKSTAHAVRKKIIHSMNMIMLMGTLTQCAPENETSSTRYDTSYDAPLERTANIYVVVPGDTLSGICRKFGNMFSVSDLKAVNQLTTDVIYIDQALTLPRARYDYAEDDVPVATPFVPENAHISYAPHQENTQTSVQRGTITQIGQTDASQFIQAAARYHGYPYVVGGTGSTPEAGIDCSQLIINALIGTWCIPEHTDTNTNGLKSISQKIGNKSGQPGDFIIMGGKTPHIAIITENLWGGRYTTFDASPRQKIVGENTRVAGNSYAVYRNPFLIWSEESEEPKQEVQAPIKTKKLAESRIKEDYAKQVASVARTVLDHQSEYEEVERATGVPWQIIAAIHHREWSLDFQTVLHNGERIIGTDKKTKLVPAGHGPFATWAEWAIDAIKTHYVRCPVKELSLDNANLLKVAEYLKSFNGEGYNRAAGGNPYLYAGLVWPEWENYYTKWLYTRDHKYSAKTIDKRPGTIPVILHLLGAGEIASTEETSIAENIPHERLANNGSKTVNLDFVTSIRTIPVTLRKAFLQEYGSKFGIGFAHKYRGSAAQNTIIASLLKKNKSFRAIWSSELLSWEKHDEEIAFN